MPDDDAFEIDLRTGAPTPPSEPTAVDPLRSGGVRPRAAASRFPPGTLIGGRYRVVGLLGRGGMGEVYRAEDLRLGEDVALKFLAPALADNPGRRARFLAEAKVARKLTHANLCRIHDFVEVDGECFISMEYVDGEDLASLLRRIGRLSPDKALDVAQQLCLGLAAAHERGVLHRDLKPANVMLDAHGRVHLMDFGLAALANEVAAEEKLAGTPRYMAPEQLRGGEVTMKSDLYALGLVLHEIFVGGLPAPDYLSQTGTGAVAPDVDPDVFRVIAACLEPEPRSRPTNAIAVAAALPGGDPLAAAVRAGELPSPAMVAAAASPLAFPKRFAAALAAASIAAMLLVATYTMTINPYCAPSDWVRAPEALVDRAKEVVRTLGFRDRPAHEAAGISVDAAYLDELRRTRSGADRWTPLRDPRPAAARVWWRGSPRPLATFEMAYTTKPDEPPRSDGDVFASFSMAGDLLAFEARPAPGAAPAAGGGAVPEAAWTDLFARAGLDRSRFRETGPGAVPAGASDSRRSWEGPAPEGAASVRVDGASLGGSVVGFSVVRPWDGKEAPASASRFFMIAEDAVQLVAFLGFLFFAARNVRKRRGDLRAAMRLGAFLAICGTAYWICQTNEIRGPSGSFWPLTHGVGQALFGGVFGGAMYLAVEPFIRRRLPHLLVGSTRLLEGRVFDPLVGRDILAGAAGALVVELLVGAVYGLSVLGVDVTDPPRRIHDSFGLYDLRSGLAALFGCARLGPTMAIMIAGSFAAAYAWLKRRRLAFAITAVLGGVLFAKYWVFESPALQILFGVLTYLVGMFVLVRFGMLGAGVFGALAFANTWIPVTFDLGAWYSRSAAAYLVAFIVLLAWAWRAATTRSGARASALSTTSAAPSR